MTIPQFKAWLDEHVLYLGSLDEFRNESEVVEQICDEGYRHAVELNLTDCITAWRPGVVGLMAMRDAIPEPKIKQVYDNQQEAADRLGVSRRTIKRLIDDDELDYTPIKGRYTFTEEQIQAYLAGEKSETLFG